MWAADDDVQTASGRTRAIPPTASMRPQLVWSRAY